MGLPTKTDMRRRLAPLAALVALLAVSAVQAQTAADGVVGAWQAEESYYRATILVERDAGGSLRAFFADADLRPGAPLSAVAVRGDSVFFEAAEVGARFRGAFSSDGPAIRGTLTQGEVSVPLTLVPATAAAPAPAAARPQHPEPPYPYAVEDVAFEGGAPGVRLAATLTVPDGPGPHPAVVLVPGTGDNDRDFEVYGHRPFLVLADRLTRRGVAVLRYDERGVGGSGGDPHATSFDDEGRDVAAAVRYLQGRAEVDAGRVGLVGHSSGGANAPYVHERMERAAFLVLLMAPAAPMGELFRAQGPRMAAAHGASAAEVEADRALGDAIVDAAAADTDSLTAAAAMAAAYDAAGWPEGLREAGVRANTSPAYRDLARYDPAPALRRLDVPVLAVYGRADLAVTPDENAGSMAAALAASPSPDATVLVLGGLNHYLQPSETGLEDEAAATTATVDSRLLDVVSDWVATRAGVGT